jgi:signal transduction histidine kinase
MMRLSPGRILERGATDGLAPEKLIGCLSAGVFCGLLIIMQLLMLPQDLEMLGRLNAGAWLSLHVAFRLLTIVPLGWLIYRAAAQRTERSDFIVFMVLGFLYAAEGSLFNLSYFLAFIEIMVAISWFSTVPFRLLVWLLPLAGVLYSLLLYRIDLFQDVGRTMISDNIIAVAISTFGSLVGASFRDFWQRLNAELVKKHIEDNSRLIDLGEQLGVIFHDVNNSLGLIKGHVELIRARGHDEQIAPSLERLDKATDHIVKLQQFVLGMSRDDKQDIRWVPGAELEEMLRVVVLDICADARHCVRFVIDPRHSYRCSPSALGFALINAVNNAYQAAAAHGRLEPRTGREPFAISVAISKDVGGMTIVEVRDNGPGFAPKTLPHLFVRPVTTKHGKGHGLGLRNIMRYMVYQGGQVQAFNDGGAVLRMTIPG